MSIVVDNVVDLVGYFSDVATTQPPFLVILLAIGALLTGVSVTIFGGLALGALLSPFTAGKY
jgi:hypothetical protein